MIGVGVSVEVAIPLVFGELLLESLLNHERVGALGEHLFKEIYVAGMMDGVEFPVGRMPHDHHAAFPHERLASVEVEEIAEPETHHQDRVHHRVDIVRADVGQPHRQDVGLALDGHDVLS